MIKQSTMFASPLLMLLICSAIIPTSLGFSIRNNNYPSSQPLRPFVSSIVASSCSVSSLSKTTLSSSSSFSNPTQEESVQLGIREWPQQTKSQSTWEEEVKDGETLTRYILQGSGDLTVIMTDSDPSSTTSKNNRKKFDAGVLVEVTGPATLNWVKKGSDDIIILTPGYEQGGLLAGVAFLFVVLCGALVAGVGS